jgi:hypothetical protein
LIEKLITFLSGWQMGELFEPSCIFYRKWSFFEMLFNFDEKSFKAPEKINIELIHHSIEIIFKLQNG